VQPASAKPHLVRLHIVISCDDILEHRCVSVPLEDLTQALCVGQKEAGSSNMGAKSEGSGWPSSFVRSQLPLKAPRLRSIIVPRVPGARLVVPSAVAIRSRRRRLVRPGTAPRTTHTRKTPSGDTVRTTVLLSYRCGSRRLPHGIRLRQRKPSSTLQPGLELKATRRHLAAVGEEASSTQNSFSIPVL